MPNTDKRDRTEYSRQYRVTHKELLRVKAREYSRLVREKLMSELGRKCVRCGISDSRVLQVDHKRGGAYAENKSTHTRGSRAAYKDFRENPGKYQLLCANCNWLKRVDNGEVPQLIS